MARKYTISEEERERRRQDMQRLNAKADLVERGRLLGIARRKSYAERKNMIIRLQERVKYLEDIIRQNGLDYLLDM